MPSTREMSFFATASTYCLAYSNTESSVTEINWGQPPRHAANATRSMSNSLTAPMSCSPRKSPSMLTEPFDSSDSQRDIERIVNHANRPVPEWNIDSRSAGTAEPVKMNWPCAPRRSISVRISSQSWGITCHSSIRRGVLPEKMICGRYDKNCLTSSRVAAELNNSSLFEKCLPVVVLPQALGPSISTPPMTLRYCSSRQSTTLGL